MSTANFLNNNAYYIYAYENFEFQEVYNDFIEQVQEEFRAEFNKDFVEEDSFETGLRSYPGKIFGHLYPDFIYDGLDTYVDICMVLISRSGYYFGGNLDWNITITVDSIAWDYGDEIELEYFSDEERREHEPKFRKQLDTFLEGLIEQVEKIYERMTTPLRCVGRASNGEAFYEKIS